MQTNEVYVNIDNIKKNQPVSGQQNISTKAIELLDKILK